MRQRTRLRSDEILSDSHHPTIVVTQGTEDLTGERVLKRLDDGAGVIVLFVVNWISFWTMTGTPDLCTIVRWVHIMNPTGL